MDQVFTSDRPYFIPFTKRWFKHRFDQQPEGIVIFGRKVPIDLETLREKNVLTLSPDCFLSTKAHKEFFESEDTLDIKYRENIEYLCRTNGFKEAFDFLCTERGGIWRWEHQWKYSYQQLFLQREFFSFLSNGSLNEALELLGLSNLTDLKAINRNFRLKSKLAHPDAERGSNSKFIRLKAARDLLAQMIKEL